MNRQTLHRLGDWCFIILVVICIIGTTTTSFLWDRVFHLAPAIIFVALCLLFLNHISLKECFQSKDKEFFFMCGGIILSMINMVLVKSHVGAIFTIADFLLVLYLADKVRFDKIQLGVIVAVCFLIWFYWQFFNRETYLSSHFNTNTPPIFMFAFFCIFVSYFLCVLPNRLQMPKWAYPVIAMVFVFLIAKRSLDFLCRGVILGLLAWTFTFFILPKKKQTIPLVIGLSLLFPIIYVLLWITGSVDGLLFMGKRFASGRDYIWYEFFKAFIHHPITGIGSNFDIMLPNLAEHARIVHNAFLDLLFVHGIPVFLVVLYLLSKRIEDVILKSSGLNRDVCLASIYGSLTLGTFENFFILSPYNIMFMMIFVICHTFSQREAGSEKMF